MTGNTGQEWPGMTSEADPEVIEELKQVQQGLDERENAADSLEESDE